MARTTRFLTGALIGISLMLTGAAQSVYGKQQTVTTITSSANPSNPGDTVTITATVTSQQGGQSNQHCPDGTVQFQVNGANYGSPVQVNPLQVCNGGGGASASASAVITITFPNAGNYPVVAIYGSDHDFDGSISETYTQTVGPPSPIATTTAIFSSGTPSIVGAPVTFTAVVTPAQWGFGVPTGTVTFTSGTTTLFIGTLNSGGWLDFTTSSLPEGVDVIVATYGGDSTFSGSATTGTQTVNAKSKTATSVALAASPTSVTVGDKVWVTATVTPTEYAAGPPTGTVTFTSGNVAITATLTDQAWVTVTTDALALGADTITASYSGDTNYSSSSATATELVNAPQSIATSVEVVTSPPTSQVGDPVWITATVTPAKWDFGDPTGTVTIQLTDAHGNKSTLFSGALPPEGWVQFTTLSLPRGANSITATYSGDSHYSASVSVPATEQVGPVSGKIATSVALVASPGTTLAGEPVWLTATVTPEQWTFGNPTGNVTFTSGGVTINATLLNGPSAAWVTVMTTALPQGNHTITATYSGDASYAGSTATAEETVNSLGIDTTIALVSSPATSTFGEPVTITVTVIPGLWGYGTPPGTVTVTSGSLTLTGTLNADGWIDFVTSALPQGTHTITATYGGSSIFKGSTATVTQTVNAP